MPQIHRLRLLIATGLLGVCLTLWASQDPFWKTFSLVLSPWLGISLGFALLVSIHPRPSLAKVVLLPISGGALSWGIGFLCIVSLSTTFPAVLIALLSWVGAWAYLLVLAWVCSCEQRWSYAARAALWCLPAFFPFFFELVSNTDWGGWTLLLGILLWWAGFVGALLRQERECKALRELGLVK